MEESKLQSKVKFYTREHYQDDPRIMKIKKFRETRL